MPTRSWNRVELIGNLTRDPELRYTPTGTAVVTFSIATNRTFMTDGEKREEADFHRIVAWSKLAELCSQLLKKGNRVFVSGRLQNREWEGQDGAKRQVTEIVIEDMLLLTSRESGGNDYVPEELPTRSASDMMTSPTVSSPDSADEVSEEKPSTKKDKEPDKKEEPNPPSSKATEGQGKQPEKEEVEDLDDLPF